MPVVLTGVETSTNSVVIEFPEIKKKSEIIQGDGFSTSSNYSFSDGAGPTSNVIVTMMKRQFW